MKQYSVYFTEPVTRTYPGQRFNKDTKRWEDAEMSETSDTFTFFSLAAAKKLIRQHLDKYKGSCITKTWANGDWENCGEIQLTDNNRTFIANTRQKKSGY